MHCKVHVVSEYKNPGNVGEFTSEMYERCQAKEGSGDGVVLATGCEGVWQQTDQDLVENGTDAILGADPIVLQFAHLGSSALAFETLEQGAHARL